MKHIKTILLLGFSAFLVLQSYDLIRVLLITSPNDYSTSGSLFSAFLINLFITGIFAFPGFVLSTHKLIGNSYYRLKNPELLSKIYKYLGVEYFKYSLLLFFWGSKKNREKYFNGTKSGIENFVYQSKQSEFGHLGAFVAIACVTILLLFYGYFLLCIFTTVMNIILNVYPVILQRFHRVRIDALYKRFNI